MKLHDILRRMAKEGASDLFLKVGSPPSLRIDGRICFLQTSPLSVEDSEEIFEFLKKVKGFESSPIQQEIDLAHQEPGVGRFRVNIYRQQGKLTFIFRALGASVPPFESLDLPEKQCKQLATIERGLVVITGTTGSGKSTTLASMLNYVNEHANKHLITLEDPIEFVYTEKRCIISQREVGRDTQDFVSALRSAMRQSPDVIMIGEMRDVETMEAAVHAAETGHAVFSTLHTTNATQTVDRIINFFPPYQHTLIKQQLANVLEGVMSQRLIIRKGGKGRVPCIEIMMRSPRIRELLVDGRVADLYKSIYDGEYYGSQTYNQALVKLYKANKITLEEALKNSDNPDELKLEIKGIVKGSRSAL